MSGPRVVIVGAEPTHFGHDQWARHHFPVKTLDRGLALRGRILDAYEVAGAPIRRPFRYRGLGTMATVGPAVGDTFGLEPSGVLGQAPWTFVYIAFLVGWVNRFTSHIQWLCGLFGRHRGERVILADSPIRAVSATAPIPAIHPVQTGETTTTLRSNMDVHQLLGNEADSLLGSTCNGIPKESLVLPGPDYID